MLKIKESIDLNDLITEYEFILADGVYYKYGIIIYEDTRKIGIIGEDCLDVIYELIKNDLVEYRKEQYE